MARKAKKEKKNGGKKAAGNGASIIDRGVYAYARSTVETSKGKKKRVIDNGDRVSVALRGMSVEEVVKVAKDNGVEIKKYPNAGMTRMNLANKLRGMVRKKLPVTIAGKSVATV